MYVQKLSIQILNQPVKMSDGVVTVIAFFEDSGDSEGHQPIRRERKVEGQRGRIVRRLRQVLQKRANSKTT